MEEPECQSVRDFVKDLHFSPGDRLKLDDLLLQGLIRKVLATELPAGMDQFMPPPAAGPE